MVPTQQHHLDHHLIILGRNVEETNIFKIKIIESLIKF